MKTDPPELRLAVQVHLTQADLEHIEAWRAAWLAANPGIARLSRVDAIRAMLRAAVLP